MLRSAPTGTWSAIVPDGLGLVTGFIIDPLTAWGVHLKSIGAAIQVYDKPLTVPRPPLAIVPLDNIPDTLHNSHLSIAWLTNVRKLQLRKVRGRCTGLCIQHEDGTAESLGRWDPSDTNAIVDIYHSSDGPLTSLCFYFSGNDETRRHVVNITADGTQTTGRPAYFCPSLDLNVRTVICD